MLQRMSLSRNLRTFITGVRREFLHSRKNGEALGEQFFELLEVCFERFLLRRRERQRRVGFLQVIFGLYVDVTLATLGLGFPRSRNSRDPQDG